MNPLHQFLIDLGAAKTSHSGRTFYEHLCGVESILRTWRQSPEMCTAGLFHSVYSTEKFKHVTLPMSDRSVLQQLIGENAERLVFLFAALQRNALFEFARSCDPLSPEVSAELPCFWDLNNKIAVSGDELGQVLLLHLANRLEQSMKPATGIGFWLPFAGELAQILRGFGALVPPVVAGLPAVTPEGELRAQSFYQQGIGFLQNDDPLRAIEYLSQACGECASLAEPHLLLAFAHRLGEDPDAAKREASMGRELLDGWGVAWHKHLSIDRWRQLADLAIGGAQASEMREIFNEMLDAKRRAQGHITRDIPFEADASTPSDQANAARFFAYLQSVRTHQSKRAVKWYPGLTRIPWYDPADFPVARELESRFAEIKAEALKVQPGFYHEESEQIGRTGSWQVSMFYEQGRRNDFVSDQCPVTASILDSHPSIRRSAGLIYLSKMAPHTHVAAHQASSNIRVRCHLALSIPKGDCAIRVGDEAHHWEEGKCIVFDDTFEHEVWNRTDEERLVLLVDLWHPGLSPLERDALDTVNWLGIWRANSMMGTWQRNDGQRRKEGKPDAAEAADLVREMQR